MTTYETTTWDRTADRVIQVLLIDDHAMLREALQLVFDRTPGFKVVGAAGDAQSGISIAEREHPNVVLMDIEMPGLDPFAAAERIRSILPDTALVFLSAHVTDRFLRRALDLGAKGYLTKRESPQSLVEAVRRVAAGEEVFSGEVADRMHPKPTGDLRTRGDSLSPREQEVLRYVAMGHTKRSIAELMGLSIKTVEGHTDHLMKKLDIHNKVDLARYAIREGLTSP